MDLNKIPLMSAITRKLEWLSQRQQVISENIANANTPGYRARVIVAEDFSDLVNNKPGDIIKPTANQNLRKTSSKHLAVNSPSAGNDGAKVKVDESASDGSVNGNTVVLENQMMEMAETQMEYSTMVNLYRRQVGLLKSALGSRSR